MQLTTIREQLTKQGFNWTEGLVVFQAYKDTIIKENIFQDPIIAIEYYIEGGEPLFEGVNLLDYKFDSGHGLNTAPEFVAYDMDNIYVKTEYDGSTGCVAISLHPNTYYDSNYMRTPCL